MSDEEVQYVKKQKNIHYGSLEDKERARLAALDEKGKSDDEDAPNSTPQVHVSQGN